MSAVHPVPAGARAVTGPSALGDDPRRFARLTWTLAVTQFRLKFYGSVLGYLWQLVRPLLLFGVLYVVFTQFLRLGADVRFFPVVLLTGIVLYSFVNEAVSGCVGSLVEREPLLRKVEFPRMAIPCAVVLTALMNLGLNLLAVVVFAVITGVPLAATLWQVPLVLALLVTFALGIGLLVSALFVRYRDVSPIADVFLQLLFYGSPIIYTLELVEERIDPDWLLLNPFAVVLQAMRHAAIDPRADGAFGFDAWQPFAGLAIAAALLALGFVVFRRSAPYVAEEL
jgi:ABC-2 type transport system permease protein